MSLDNVLSNTIVDYQSKKVNNFKTVELMAMKVSTNMLNRIDSCGSYLLFVSNEKMDKKRLYKANFCGNRFCPMCAWRKSKQDAFKLGTIMFALQKERRNEFIFLTLTVPNVKGEELSDAIKHLHQSFGRLLKTKDIRGWGKRSNGQLYNGIAHGYMRKLEVTYNQKRDDYHPHLHILIPVSKSYFKSKKYLSRYEWLERWRKAARDESITQVDVKRVKLGDDSTAVNEMTKYVAKDEQYLQGQEIFDNFYAGLKGKKLIHYAGIMQDYASKFEAGELDKYIEEPKLEEFTYFAMAKFNYQSLKYEVELKKMSEVERLNFVSKYIKNKVDDADQNVD